MDTAFQAALDDDPPTERSKIGSIDAHVGSRIRLRRRMMGMSQDQLGRLLGISFQQIQKYELGINRVGASRVFDISCLLDVPIGFFFDALPDKLSDQHTELFGVHRSGPDTAVATSDTVSVPPPVHSTAAELLRFYDGIADPIARLRLFELIKSMSSAK